MKDVPVLSIPMALFVGTLAGVTLGLLSLAGEGAGGRWSCGPEPPQKCSGLPFPFVGRVPWFRWRGVWGLPL